MSLVVNDTGKVRFLDFLTGFGGEGLNGCVARLFTNNLVPAHGDLLGAYTEAIWLGYAAQPLNGWMGSILNASFHAVASPAAVSFGNTSGANQQAFGYFVTDPTNTFLLFAERFAVPPVTIPTGTTFFLAVQFTQTSEF